MKKISRNISGKDLIKILERDYGFKSVRTRGSHCIVKSFDGRQQACIPIHNNETLGIGILRKILKDCGIFPPEIFGNRSTKREEEVVN